MPEVSEVLLRSVQNSPWGWALLGTVILALIRVWPAMAKLRMDEHAQIRKEYVDEIKGLRLEVVELRKENDTLRREIRDLHDLFAGTRRQEFQEQISTIRISPVVSEVIREATERVAKLKGDE